MVENVGVAVSFSSPSVSVQKLFPLPVSCPTFQFPISPDVGQWWQCHMLVGHGRKCGGSRYNHITISFRSKVISTSGLMAAILSSGCLSMSGNVGSAISKTGVVETMGVAAEVSFVVVL